MTYELGIYRAAKLLIDKHGDEAALYAAGRADLLLEEGDTTCATAWRRIMGRSGGASAGQAVGRGSEMRPIAHQ
jgi:hypothetical protein